jgi:hypothetical protein
MWGEAARDARRERAAISGPRIGPNAWAPPVAKRYGTLESPGMSLRGDFLSGLEPSDALSER